MTTQKNPTEKEELSGFLSGQKQVLEARLIEAKREHRRARANLAVDPNEFTEVCDRGKFLVSRDVEIAKISRSASEIARIHKALLKIGLGNYGVCEGCDEFIPRERLEAIPEASRCASCQKAHDRELEEAPAMQ